MNVPAHRARAHSILGGVVAVALIAFAVLVPSIAQAAVPVNDDIGAPTAIGSLPFSDALDTSEATTAADDPGCAGNGHTIWYTLTLPADVRVDANTFGSTFDTTISVYTGTPGALTQIACNDDNGGLQSRVVVDTTGGQTYYVMVGSFGSQGGGSLTLSVGEAPPPPPPQCSDGIDNDFDNVVDGADPGCDGPTDDDETDPPPPPPPPVQMTLSLNPLGRVDTNGVATISGSVTCNQPVFVWLDGTLSQTFARRVGIQGWGNSAVSCTPPSVPWSATVSASNGSRFGPGSAQASFNAFGCDGFTCAFDGKSADVRLRGGR